MYKNQRGKVVRGFPHEKYDFRKGRVQRTQRDIEAKLTVTATKPMVQRENSLPGVAHSAVIRIHSHGCKVVF